MAFILSGIAIGAAMGGGMAYLNHKDVMQGALMGGVMGGVTGGIGSLAEAPVAASTEAMTNSLPGALTEEAAMMNGAYTPQNMFGNSMVPGASANAGGGIRGASDVNNFWGGGLEGSSAGLANPNIASMAQVNPTTGLYGGGQGLNTPTGSFIPQNTATPLPQPAPSPFTGIKSLAQDPMGYLKAHPWQVGAGALGGYLAPNQQQSGSQTNPGHIDPYDYHSTANPNYTGYGTSPFIQHYTPLPQQSLASGGIAGLEGNQAYPMSQQDHTQYSSPSQLPASAAVINSDYDAQTDPYTGTEVVQRMASGGVSQAVTDYNNMLMQRAQQEYVNNPPPNALLPQSMRQQTPVYTANSVAPSAPAAPAAPAAPTPDQAPTTYIWGNDVNAGPMSSNANGGLMASGGGISSLGGYSDGGQLLRGPGDGVSDSIPAQIGDKQPARLADGEFVVPSRIVSELGNGSTDAGAKQLYSMMNRIQQGRKKSIGSGNVAVNTRADKHLPA